MKIGFIGDIILSPNQEIDEALVQQLQANDFNIANLEAPFIRPEMVPSRGKGLHQLTDSCELLHRLNVKTVSLANNHMMDFGAKGIRHTIEVLNKNGIGYFGAGENIEQSRQAFEIVLNGKHLRFYGALQDFFQNRHFAQSNKSGVAPWPQASYNNTKSDAYNFLFLHWNQEFEGYPEPASKFHAEQIAKNYDLIIGSHAHCIQGIQLHNQTPIVYSLGNFSLPHQQYFNTFLGQYPPKSYKGFIYVWNSDAEDNILSINISSCGEKVELDKSYNLTNFLNNHSNLNTSLNSSYKKYRKFYSKKRNIKKRPILSRYKLINEIIFKGHTRCILVFQHLEITIAKILDKFGLRQMIKNLLSKLIKRYK